MPMAGEQRVWARRLALGVVLVTCAGGGAFVLVDRPPADCAVVGEMMHTYSDFQAATAQSGPNEPQAQAAAADGEAQTADTLHRQAREIALPELRTAAVAFAEAVASSAQAQLDSAAMPAELDPFDAVLPSVDPAELAAGERFSAAVHVLLVACPSAPRPIGMS
ncbi:MAG: hypothetical protein ABWY93_11690 [Mycobacterium sp.]